jgi:heptosyltransferase-2
MVAPLLDYMPGVRKGIVVDLPRKRVAFEEHSALAKRLRAEGYGQMLVMPRTWKSVLAPYLAGIPVRTDFLGEGRFGPINDLRFGEHRPPHMVDRCAALALPGRQRLGLAVDSDSIALAPRAVGPSKRWPELARRLLAQG